MDEAILTDNDRKAGLSFATSQRSPPARGSFTWIDTTVVPHGR